MNLNDSNSSMAVLIPCLNEEKTIYQVVTEFKTYLPEAEVFVFDNGSCDSTVEQAFQAGASIRHESKLGKGNVVRRMFADVEADTYLLVDGDGTYDPGEAQILIKKLQEEKLDMVVGVRSSAEDRFGHKAGNRVFNWLYRRLFGSGFNDIFSGYRAFSRRYVKSFPTTSSGFEIETEMSIHASQLHLPVGEVPTTYSSRPEGSVSKLRTLTDGWKIFRAMFSLLKENRPLVFFSSLASFSAVFSLGLGIPVVIEFAETGLVEKLPTAVLATGLALVSILLVSLGLVLDLVAKGRVEAKRLAYLHTR